MFEHMEVAEQVYAGGTPSKTPTRAESNRGSHVRKRKGWETASPTNPKKGRTGKRKNIYRPSERCAHRSKNICLLHGPGHSSEECKVLKVYSEKYAAQRPHKSTEAKSGCKPKHSKVVEFNRNTQEVNFMQDDDIPISREKKEKSGYQKVQDKNREIICIRKSTYPQYWQP